MKRKREVLLIPIFFVIVLIIIGVSYFMLMEGWSLVDAFYFVIMTITTVGYGDLVPTHDTSKIVTAIFALMSIPIVLMTVSLLVENYFEGQINRMEERLKEVIAKEKQIEQEIEAETKG